jgi:hypothetical protein
MNRLCQLYDFGHLRILRIFTIKPLNFEISGITAAADSMECIDLIEKTLFDIRQIDVLDACISSKFRK